MVFVVGQDERMCERVFGRLLKPFFVLIMTGEASRRPYIEASAA